MKIISENVGLLTNPEVMALLEPLGAAADAPPATVRALPIERTVHAYLKGQGCQPASKQQIDAFAAAVQPFNLMRAELLQLVNLRPTQAVEVHLIVEDIEERLGEEQVEALLLAVAQNLPGKVPPMPR